MGLNLKVIVRPRKCQGSSTWILLAGLAKFIIINVSQNNKEGLQSAVLQNKFTLWHSKTWLLIQLGSWFCFLLKTSTLHQNRKDTFRVISGISYCKLRVQRFYLTELKDHFEVPLTWSLIWQSFPSFGHLGIQTKAIILRSPAISSKSYHAIFEGIKNAKVGLKRWLSS